MLKLKKWQIKLFKFTMDTKNPMILGPWLNFQDPMLKRKEGDTIVAASARKKVFKKIFCFFPFVIQQMQSD